MNIKTVYMLTILLPGIIAGPTASAEPSTHAEHSARAEQSQPSPYAAVNANMMQAMHNLMPTGDVDYDFMRGMIPHHQGAIDMARVLLEQGGSEQMRELARDILSAQEAEITQMQVWMHEYGPPSPGENAQDVIAAWQRIDQRMMTDMHNVFAGAAGDITSEFVQGMIPHHVAAVDMAYVLLAHSTHPELRTLAKAVVREQEREIRELKAWQNERRDRPVDPHEDH